MGGAEPSGAEPLNSEGLHPSLMYYAPSGLDTYYAPPYAGLETYSALAYMGIYTYSALAYSGFYEAKLACFCVLPRGAQHQTA